jgi:hypothetical protein
MCEHQEHAFDGASAIGAGAQIRGKATLGAAKHAFGLPALAVFLLRKVCLHLAAVRAAGPSVRMPAMIDRDDCFANSPLFLAAPMVLFGIVRSVRHESTNRDAAHRFLHGRKKPGASLLGPRLTMAERMRWLRWSMTAVSLVHQR